MLITFKLSNFRSFLEEQTFSFAASPDRTFETTHCIRTGMKSLPKVSKAALVFGPNASGKSNLLAGLATLRDLILHSTSYSDHKLRERHTPFRFGPSVDQPTAFEIDVLLNHVRYRYSMSYDAERICSERMLVYRTGKSQRWFERVFDPATRRDAWTAFSPSFNGPREMWRKATRDKALFLTAAAQLNSEQLAPFVHYVEHCIEIVLPADLTALDRIVAHVQDDVAKERVLAMLRTVDLPVHDVRVAEHDTEPTADRDAGTHATLEFLYARPGSLPVWLESEFEAAGTHRLFALLGPLLSAIEHGRLLLVDEFDTSVHPLIARFLIQLINDPDVSYRGAQLMLISHNTTLMDLDILRRDEIWLMQLSGERASRLAPLLRSGPRKRELIAKAYMKGHYGAVPKILPQATAPVEPENPGTPPQTAPRRAREMAS